MQEVEIFVMLDDDGNYCVHIDRDSIEDTYDEEIGGANNARRLICVKLNVPTPRAIEVVATLPAEPSTVEIKVGA